MIKTSLCGLLFLSTTMVIQCMEENNNNIGYIDKLVIQHEAKEIGFSNLEKRINNHFLSPENSFVIMHTIWRVNNSDLSRAVFRITDEHEVIFNSANVHNKKSNMIDHCTEWKQSQNLPDSTTLTANFYNKTALLKTLHTIDEEQQNK